MNYWKALFSPFKLFKLKFYFGKIAIGTPYFFPRKAVKISKDDAMHEAFVEYAKFKEQGKNISFDDIYHNKLNQKVFVPKKFGFDFVGLGWKSKWDSIDYRFEWQPLMSFVFYKWQFVIFIRAPHPDNYWTCWLYYERNTDKSKPIAKRIEQARREFPCTWTTYYKDPKTGENLSQETIDYWDIILKKKWIKNNKS